MKFSAHNETTSQTGQLRGRARAPSGLLGEPAERRLPADDLALLWAPAVLNRQPDAVSGLTKIKSAR